MRQNDPITSLTELGFTPLEAQTYTYILQNAGVTGYRVAQALSKAMANVYKAIENLESKGAVLVERDTHRRLRAVPPQELFDRLERSFKQRRERAEQALAQLPKTPEDDSVYHLSSWEQVSARFDAMLQRCQHNVLLDVSPEPLREFGERLSLLAQRGIEITLRCDEPLIVEGVEVVCIPENKTDLEPWQAEWLNVVVDGSEHMITLRSPGGGLLQAVWSGSPYLSWVYYSGLSCEIILDALQAQVHDGATTQQLQATIDRFTNRLWTSKAPGRKLLLEKIERQRSERSNDNAIRARG